MNSSIVVHNVRPVMVASENGRAGMVAAMELLRAGGSALDAVEMAARVTEDDPEDHSVGYSGVPNILGEVELDASIMDGRTLRSGAVAALRGYGNPILLARQVMERLPHVLLVGQGAAHFAEEIGFQPQDQRSEAGMALWRSRFDENGLDPGDVGSAIDIVNGLTRALVLRDRQGAGKKSPLGTVNFLALDEHGDLASAVSTSGIGWKYPGRVGDSPIVGAGNYADNRYGAVACTGMGELAIRVNTARSLVLYLKMGMSLLEAGKEAMRDLDYVDSQARLSMNFIALTPEGNCAGFTTIPGKQYMFMNAEMNAPSLADRISM